MIKFLNFKKKKKLHRNEAIIFGRPGNNIVKEAYTRLKDNILCYCIDGDKKVIKKILFPIREI